MVALQDLQVHRKGNGTAAVLLAAPSLLALLAAIHALQWDAMLHYLVLGQVFPYARAQMLTAAMPAVACCSTSVHTSLPSGELCRGVVPGPDGGCDVPEYCTLTSPNCPADGFKDINTVSYVLTGF